MRDEKPRTHKAGYLPTLDGWRAIAITSVMLLHDSVHHLGPLSTRYFHPNGAIGVDIFFAISGILICSRLLEEERLMGSISLKHFYLRRAFRILPPAILYLATVAILGATGTIHASIGECIMSLFFLRNYPGIWIAHVHFAGWFTGHFWSLAVEEHFYLLLPVLIVFLPRKVRLWTLLGLAVLVIVHRYIALSHHLVELIQFHTEIRLDQLLLPAALAVFIREYESRWRGYSALRIWPILFPIAAIAPLVIHDFATQKTIFAVILPLMVAGSTLHADNVFGAILEHPALRFIGKISYSLYLWQQFFFTINEYGSAPFGVLNRFPVNFIATITCALLSFYLIEKPMIRLGHRLAPPTTPGR